MAAAPAPNNNILIAAIVIGGVWFLNRSRMNMAYAGRVPAGAMPVYGSYGMQPSYGMQQQQLYAQQQAQQQYSIGSAIGQLVNKWIGNGQSSPARAANMAGDGAPIAPVNPPMVYTDATQYEDVNGLW